MKQRKFELRRIALGTIKRIIERERAGTPINPDTLAYCADRIALADGESDGVRMIRQAATSERNAAYDLLRRAFEASKDAGKARHGGNRHPGGIPWNKGKVKKVPVSASEVLERLSMLAASPAGAVLVKYGNGALGAFEIGQRMPKTVEVLGYYDIRADARDMLADIKEAMA